MGRREAVLNVRVLCVAHLLIAPLPSFGAEMADSIGQASAATRAEQRLVSESGSSKNSWAGAPAGSAFLHDDGLLRSGYNVQAKSDDLVTCSFVGKVVMCRRTVRSRPPQQLLPRKLPRE